MKKFTYIGLPGEGRLSVGFQSYRPGDVIPEKHIETIGMTSLQEHLSLGRILVEEVVPEEDPPVAPLEVVAEATSEVIPEEMPKANKVDRPSKKK